MNTIHEIQYPTAGFNHIGLFEGIGGFSLAAHWAGWQTVAVCEWDQFCQSILKYYFPKAIQHYDIRNTDFSIYRGLIDIVTGGFPCQGFSVAGNRLGVDDDRYLWPEMRRAYQQIKPSIIIGENVTGILSMEDKSGIYRDVFAKVEGRTITRLCEVDKYEAIYTRQAKMLVDSICNDLEEDGYEVQTIVVPAASVQAPHRRDRTWFIAYANGFGRGRNGSAKAGSAQVKGPISKDQWQRIRLELERNGTQRNVTNTNGAGRKKRHISAKPNEEGFTTRSFNTIDQCRINQWGNFPTVPPVLFGDDGISTKLDGITFSALRRNSLKCSGNAVVPQIPFEFFKAINAQLKV